MTSSTAHTDPIRDRIRAEWAARAAREGPPQLTSSLSPAYKQVISMAEIRAGERVLDLACGRGNAVLAQCIGPDGYLLGLDLTPAALDVGRRWAHDSGLSFIEFRAIPNEMTLDVPPASFDAGTCTFGLSYMPARVAALRAVHAALKPGGRFAASTWGRCTFFEVPHEIISRRIGRDPWDAAVPGPFALRDRDAFARCLSDAGFVGVAVQALEMPMGPNEPEAFWQFAVRECAGPWQCWPAEADAQRDELREDALATLRTMFPDGVVRLMGKVLVAVGAKASE